VFYLRRARAKAVHAWRLFRSRQEAVQYAMEMLKGDEDAARWADAVPAHDFDDLVRRFGLSPGA
jgi:hypothetical protein